MISDQQASGDKVSTRKANLRETRGTRCAPADFPLSPPDARLPLRKATHTAICIPESWGWRILYRLTDTFSSGHQEGTQGIRRWNECRRCWNAPSGALQPLFGWREARIQSHREANGHSLGGEQAPHGGPRNLSCSLGSSYTTSSQTSLLHAGWSAQATGTIWGVGIRPPSPADLSRIVATGRKARSGPATRPRGGAPRPGWSMPDWCLLVGLGGPVTSFTVFPHFRQLLTFSPLAPSLGDLFSPLHFQISCQWIITHLLSDWQALMNYWFSPSTSRYNIFMLERKVLFELRLVSFDSFPFKHNTCVQFWLESGVNCDHSYWAWGGRHELPPGWVPLLTPTPWDATSLPAMMLGQITQHGLDRHWAG